MNKTLLRILSLVSKGEVRISDHGYDELAEDNIFARNIIDGVREAKVVENYPDYPKGSSVLVLQKDQDGKPGPCGLGNSPTCRLARCGHHSLSARP